MGGSGFKGENTLTGLILNRTLMTLASALVLTSEARGGLDLQVGSRDLRQTNGSRPDFFFR
jgi:hypothetical protein